MILEGLMMGLLTNFIYSVGESVFQGLTKEDFKSRMGTILHGLELEFKKRYPECDMQNSFLVRQENCNKLFRWVLEENILDAKTVPELNRRNYDQSEAGEEQVEFVIRYIQKAVSEDDLLRDRSAYNLSAATFVKVQSIEEKQDKILRQTENTTPKREEYRPNSFLSYTKRLEDTFIETKQYKQAWEILKTRNIILLTGKSGMGKTDTSKMLAAYLVRDEGYQFRYVSAPKEQDLSQIQELMDQRSDENEIIILDDFLGSTELNGADSYLKALDEFLTEAGSYGENKKFIFNTRKTILNTAKSCSKKITTQLFGIPVIDLEEKDEVETWKDRANIFAKYCWKNHINEKVSALLKDQIWNNQTIVRILKHDNFTPFLVKKATEACVEQEPSEFEGTILELLSRPDSVWEAEIKELSRPEKDFVNILYSLSENNITWEIADECYTHFAIAMGRADEPLAQIHSSIGALVDGEDFHISFVHPSLIDYLGETLTPAEKEELSNHFVYLDQLEKIDVQRNKIKNFMNLDESTNRPYLFQLKILPTIDKALEEFGFPDPNRIEMKYLNYLYELEIVEEEQVPTLISVLNGILEKGFQDIFFQGSTVLNVFKLEYDFSPILENPGFVSILYRMADEDTIWNLISLTVPQDEKGYDFNNMCPDLQMQLGEVLQDMRENDLFDRLDNTMEEDIRDELEAVNGDIPLDDLVEIMRDKILDEWDSSDTDGKFMEKIKQNGIYNLEVEDLDSFDRYDALYSAIESMAEKIYSTV